MKVLCSADYHIKLKTKNIPEEWAKVRFRKLFDELSNLEQQVELHVVMGDFFDKMPTLEELELYYEFILGRKVRTLIIPGNHEALKKDTTFLTYLKELTNKLNPLVRIIDDYFSNGTIDFIPYNKLKEFEKGDMPVSLLSDILVTHVRGEIPPHVKSEIDLSLFDRWKVVLAGDLHSYDNCQRNILYPGSPITTSFHRSKVDTGIIIFDTDTLEHKFISLDLPQLIRKTIKAGDEMPATYPDHTIYEIEGDMAELASIADHELMDKKVTKRSTDTSLILSSSMTIEDEITEYLTFILELPADKIEKVLKIYHDNIKNNEMG